MRTRSLMPVVLVTLTVAAGACSSTKPPTTDDGADTTIAVVVKEYSIAPSVASAPVGKVTFAATNNGTMAHELVVLKTEVAPDTMVVADDKVDEDAAGISVLGEIEEFPAGKTQTKTFDMTAGRYVLICNIVGHYTRGMRTSFTVA